jgi:hypothetical protein
MGAEIEKKAKKQTNGGSKGGARFPHLNLVEALDYSKKLVSKTFNGPLPETTILVGVFNNKGPIGGVRASALKQYGLMEGDTRGYLASDLAKKIETVIPEEKADLVRKAFLTPKLFKQMYDTLQPDNVTRAKVRQAAAMGGVHVDSLEICVDCFVEGINHAGLGVKTDDGVDLSQGVSASPSPLNNGDTELEEQATTDNDSFAVVKTPPSDSAPESSDGKFAIPDRNVSRSLDKPVVTLSLTVDATSDPEKLEKQLKLLRQFGVL